jgi:hypothetical protein
VVLPKDLLYALAENTPQSSEELARIMVTTPYRLEKYGEALLSLLVDLDKS